MFVFENDSADDTKEQLKGLKSSNIEILSRDDNSKYLTDNSFERTNNLSKYRNECLNWVKNNYSHFDYTIVLDLDADLGFSIDGIYNSISWLSKNSDAGGMGSYSLYLKANSNIEFAHYDSFAVRLNNWEKIVSGKDVNNVWFRNLHPFVGSDPIKMYSCFGGLAVYKTKAFISGLYDASLGCEHVFFHKSLSENGFKMYLNPSSRFFSVCHLKGK
jgi:hypothetical protein